MKERLSGLEKMMLFSIAFTMFLLGARIIYTNSLLYIFYAWNTFLAVVPIIFSRKLLVQTKLNFKSICLMMAWLLFFPNAAYIITDLFHYTERPPVPKWYDLILVTSAAWNGLLLGIISLMQVEAFLQKHLNGLWVKLSVFVFMLLCGYGIYIGRFLRFNSWNIITKPGTLFYTTSSHVFDPIEHWKIWCFTLLFAAMFCIIYFTLKELPRLLERGNSKVNMIHE